MTIHPHMRYHNVTSYYDRDSIDQGNQPLTLINSVTIQTHTNSIAILLFIGNVSYINIIYQIDSNFST